MTTILSGTPVQTRNAVRWAGSGRSTDPDSSAAGAAATDAALDGRVANLLVVYCSVNRDLPAMLEAISSRAAADTVIVGCTSEGQLDATGPMDDGVVVLALGAGFEIQTAVARDVSNGRRAAGMLVAGAVSGLQRPEQLLMLLCDGLTYEQHEIVRGAHVVVGAAVPLVGGCSADEQTYTQTHQFHGDGRGVEILSDSVVGVGLGSDGRIGIGIGIEHGWHKTGTAFEVTASRGGVVQELDGRPALDVYLEHCGLDPALVQDELKFRRAAFGKPLGMSRRSGEDIRVIHAGDVAAGSLVCLADVPQGALVWVMEADAEGLIDAARTSSESALAGLSGDPAVAMLVFDCGARKAMLSEEQLVEEVAQLSAGAAGTPLAGLYTFGEIARTAGSRGMHNLTCVTLALG